MTKLERKYIEDVLLEAKRIKDTEGLKMSLPYVEDNISLDTLYELLKLLGMLCGRSATISLGLTGLKEGNLSISVNINPTDIVLPNKPGYFCPSCEFRDGCPDADKSWETIEDENCVMRNYDCSVCPLKCRCYGDNVLDPEEGNEDVKIIFKNNEE